jgi:outer membrane protein assembly factor BamD (BamD/ComL family)
MTTGQQGTRSSGVEDAVPRISSEPEHPYSFKNGSHIADRYEVIEPLGFGGFADVYHCHDLRLGRDVAVKVLTKKGVGLEEARAAASLDHPHTVQVYDVSELGDGTPIMVFRYVEGETLEKRLNQAQYRRLPLDEGTLRIVRQVSEALDYAHEQGVIHRDVKPSNIIMDPQGNAHLTDFGLAEVKKSEKETMMSAEVQHRMSGTIPYMAPEQLKEETPGDKHSDLYSLGVVVYEMLTGQLPYRGRDVGLIYQITSSEPLPPTLANPELPQGAEPVLLRALDKDPEKRYSSCQAFARELEKATAAYVTASAQYERAQDLFRSREWRQALAAFEALEDEAPGFRDTAHYLEQARHQVRLLELYERAQKALEQGNYQGALDTLNVLTQFASDYRVEGIRRQAREGLAQEEKRSRHEQYQQAVEQFNEGEYQACLDTLAVIRERDPDYPDAEGIEAPAREYVERQRRLRELYTRGVEQMGQERWEEAVATFETLQQEAPGYEDIDTRLVTARHLARLFSLLTQARTFLQREGFAACVDKLGELQGVSATYKRDEVSRLRQEALNRLHERADRLLREKKFEESQVALAELRERSSDYPDVYPDVDELEARAQEGIRVRDLRVKLDGLYSQAVQQLNQRAYGEALGLWRAIQRQKGDLDYADPRDVEVRARDGFCMDLYNQALGALAQKDPRRALDLWHQVRGVDPAYPDDQRVEGRAHAMIKREKTIRWWVICLGGGGIALILLVILVAVASRGCRGIVVRPTVTPTWIASPTAASTLTPSPAATPTHTPSPTPTLTPTRMPTPTATVALTGTPTPTPAPTPTGTVPDLATAIQGASIFAAPAANSQVLGGISAGEHVPVLGRSAHGRWFYVRGDRGVEGFVYAPRFDWSGDYESLPVIAPSVTPVPATFTPPPEPPYPALEMDLWDLSGRCSGGKWYKSVYVQGHGGNGVYTYYWNGEKVAGPTGESYTFEVQSIGGAMIGTGKVASGDGQVVERKLYIRAPDCAK